MDYLARREYGRAELVLKLTNAGFDAEISDAVVDRLAGEGLQDDRRFVENFLQSRVGQGKGPARVQAELKQRGLPEGLVNEVLQDCEVDWFALGPGYATEEVRPRGAAGVSRESAPNAISAVSRLRIRAYPGGGFNAGRILSASVNSRRLLRSFTLTTIELWPTRTYL